MNNDLRKYILSQHINSGMAPMAGGDTLNPGPLSLTDSVMNPMPPSPIDSIPPAAMLSADDNSPFISNRGRQVIGNIFSGLGDVFAASAGQQPHYLESSLAHQRQSVMDNAMIQKEKEQSARLNAQAQAEKEDQVRKAIVFGRQQKINAEMDDPNSSTSQLHQQVAKKIGLPPEAYQGKSATQLQAVTPLVEKMQATEIMKGNRGLMIGMKEDQRNADRITKLNEALDPTKMSRGNFSVSKQIFDRAERLESLANAYKNTNDLDSRQIEELAIGLNAMLSGANTGAQRQVEALVPKSVWGNTQKLAEFLSNNPKGTQQGAFVDRILGSISREKETARDQMNRVRFSRISGFSDVQRKSPEDFDNVLRSNDVDPDEYNAWVKGGYKPISAVQSAENAVPANVMTATNPKTGERIQSSDGGKTWQPLK